MEENIFLEAKIFDKSIVDTKLKIELINLCLLKVMKISEVQKKSRALFSGCAYFG